MMMCAFMVAEDLAINEGIGPRHEGARAVLRAWGVNMMQRPRKYKGFSLNHIPERRGQ